MKIDELFRTSDERDLPLLKHTFQLTHPESIFTADSIEKTARIRRLIAARNIFLMQEVGKILYSLNRAGIDTLILKGVALQKMYPQGVRYFRDVDILVPKEKVDLVAKQLRESGYQEQTPLLRPGAEIFQGALSYMKNGSFPILVEPHWTLGLLYPYSGRISIEDLWGRAKKSNISGNETLELSPEDTLIHLCLHFVQHNYQGWVHPACDIVALVIYHKDVFDWDVFVERVLEYNLTLPVKFSLEQTRKLFNPDIPNEVLEKLNNLKTGKLEKVRFSSFVKLSGEEYRYKKALAMIISIPPSLVPYYLWCHLFPDRRFLQYRYPDLGSRSIFYYYLYRICNLIFR